MAVLTAVLTPALLTYVERSRAQKDDSAMGEVTNAIQLALADQEIYDEMLMCTDSGSTTLEFVNDNQKYVIDDTKVVSGEYGDTRLGELKATGQYNTLQTVPDSEASTPTAYLAKRLDNIIGEEVKLTSRTHRTDNYIVTIGFGSDADDYAVSVAGDWKTTGSSASGSSSGSGSGSGSGSSGDSFESGFDFYINETRIVLTENDFNGDEAYANAVSAGHFGVSSLPVNLSPSLQAPEHSLYLTYDGNYVLDQSDNFVSEIYDDGIYHTTAGVIPFIFYCFDSNVSLDLTSIAKDVSPTLSSAWFTINDLEEISQLFNTVTSGHTTQLRYGNGYLSREAVEPVIAEPMIGEVGGGFHLFNFAYSSDNTYVLYGLGQGL